MDDYDAVRESSGIIPNIGSDIGDQGAQCFDDGDGNYIVTTRRIAPLRERFNFGGGIVDDEKR